MRSFALSLGLVGLAFGTASFSERAFAQSIQKLVCDGPNRTPLLYEDRDFKGQSLHVFLEEYEPLYLSDEETFARKASSVCVQSGYVVSLYDKEGHGIEIEGPAQLNLDTLNFDDRAYAGMAVRVETPEAIEEVPETPQSEPDYSEYELIANRFDEALASDKCETVTEAHDYLGQHVRAREPIPVVVMAELRLGRPVLGEYVKKNLRGLRRHKSKVCNAAPVMAPETTEEALAIQQRQLIDRYYTLAMQTENCETVQAMAVKIGSDLKPDNAPYAMRKMLSLSEERTACFEQAD